MHIFCRYQPPQLQLENDGLPREAKEQRTDLLTEAILGGLGASGSATDDSGTTTTFTLGPDNTITSGPIIRDVTHDVNEGVTLHTVPATIQEPKTPGQPSAVIAVDPKLVQVQQDFTGWPTSVQSSGQTSGTAGTSAVKNPNKRHVLTRELSREDMDEDINKVGKLQQQIKLVGCF